MRGLIFVFFALLATGAFAKDTPKPANVVPVLTLRPTERRGSLVVVGGYPSPDGQRLLSVGKEGYGLSVSVCQGNPIRASFDEPFSTTTGMMWLPKHGHVLVESSDQGTAEYRLGLLDADSRYHQLDPLHLIKSGSLGSGYYRLYGATTDGKSIVYGYSKEYTTKPLKRRYYKIPPEFIGKG